MTYYFQFCHIPTGKKGHGSISTPETRDQFLALLAKWNAMDKGRFVYIAK